MLTILGQSGGPTRLTANDDTFGLMTQVPDGAVMHSPGGLTDADGNTSYGAPFNLLVYASHSGTHAAQTTTKAFTSDAMPYKVRVLGVKVRCLDNRSEDFRDGYGYVRAVVEDGDGNGVWTSVLNVEGMGDMEAGDVREVPVVQHSRAVVDTDEGLRVTVTSRADSFGTNPTASFVVEVQCVRVI